MLPSYHPSVPVTSEEEEGSTVIGFVAIGDENNSPICVFVANGSGVSSGNIVVCEFQQINSTQQESTGDGLQFIYVPAATALKRPPLRLSPASVKSVCSIVLAVRSSDVCLYLEVRLTCACLVCCACSTQAMKSLSTHTLQGIVNFLDAATAASQDIANLAVIANVLHAIVTRYDRAIVTNHFYWCMCHQLCTI